MTTAAPQQDATFEDLKQDAWKRYADTVRDKTGRAYEDAEDEAWGALQDELAEIAALAAEPAAEPAVQ